jgi:hypothetical protein
VIPIYSTTSGKFKLTTTPQNGKRATAFPSGWRMGTFLGAPGKSLARTDQQLGLLPHLRCLRLA